MNNRRALLLKADIKRKLDKYDSVHIEDDMDKHGFEIEDFGKNNELLNSCFYHLLSKESDKINTISSNIHWILSCIRESEKISLNDIGIMGINHIESLQFCLFSLTKQNIFRDKTDPENITDIQYNQLYNTYKLFSGRDFRNITLSENMNNQFNIIKKMQDINIEQFKKLFFKTINDNITFLSDSIDIESRYNIKGNILSYEAKNDFLKNVIEIIDVSNRDSNCIIEGHELYSCLTKNMIERNDENSWYTCLKVLTINSIFTDNDTAYLITYFNNNIESKFKEDDWPLYIHILNKNYLDFPLLYQRKILKDSDAKPISVESFSIEPYKKRTVKDRI